MLESMKSFRVQSLAVAIFVSITSSVGHASTRVPGTLKGSIGGDVLSLDGTCSQGASSFEFWSDGIKFAVNKDMNGDGMYVNIIVLSLGNQTKAMLRYSRGGKTIYNGNLDFKTLENQTLTVDATLGRASDVPAKFVVTCK